MRSAFTWVVVACFAACTSAEDPAAGGSSADTGEQSTLDVSGGSDGADGSIDAADVDSPEPDTSLPGPDVPPPLPDTTDPEPDTTDPEPDTTDPEPDTTDPEPDTTDPEPDTTDPECVGAGDCPSVDGACAGSYDCVDGACVFEDTPDGAACDDDDACTADDVCTAGECAGTAIACDDGMSALPTRAARRWVASMCPPTTAHHAMTVTPARRAMRARPARAEVPR